MNNYEIRTCEQLARKTAGGVYEALGRFRYKYNEKLSYDILGVITYGIMDAMQAGEDGGRFSFQVAEQESETADVSDWDMLAGFTSLIEAQDYMKYQQETNPDKRYCLFEEGKPMQYQD